MSNFSYYSNYHSSFTSTFYSEAYTFNPFPEGINFNQITLTSPSVKTLNKINQLTIKDSQKIGNHKLDLHNFIEFISPQKLADPINQKLKSRYEHLVIDGVEVISDVETVSISQAYKIINSQDSTQNPTDLLAMLPAENSLTTTSPFVGDSIVFPIALFTFPLALGVFVVYKHCQFFQLNSPENKLWYNQSIFGKKGLFFNLLKKFGMAKLEIPQISIDLQKQTLSEAKLFAQSARLIDNELFSNEHFLLLAKINDCLKHNLNEYKNLKVNYDLLKIALKAYNIYTFIHQIESSYQGLKQQEFYNFVQQQLIESQNREKFQEKIENKLAEIFNEIKTEEGKKALQAYTQKLGELADNSFGLQIFSCLKENSLAHHRPLKTISDMISKLSESEAGDLKHLRVQVIANVEIFEQLRDIISLSKQQSSPDTYARMLQYIALEYRYQASFDQFEDLIEILKQWYKVYQTAISIRQQYPHKHYQQPEVFIQEIPGFALYCKYKNSLSDLG